MTPQLDVQLKRLFKSYPEFNHVLGTDPTGLKSCLLPVDARTKHIFAQEILGHLDLIKPIVGDRRAVTMVAADKADTAQQLEDWYAGKGRLRWNLGVQVGDRMLRISDANLILQREGTDNDLIRYTVTNRVQLPSLPTSLNGLASEDEVKRLMRRFLGGVADDNTQWELMVQNGTGKLQWVGRIPTVPTSGPVTITVDATSPDGKLSESTPITLQ